MTNPAPRPALRKAPDADVHPAQAEQSPPEVVIDLVHRSIDITEPHEADLPTTSPSVSSVPDERPLAVVTGTSRGDQPHPEKDRSDKARRKAEKKAKSQKKAKHRKSKGAAKDSKAKPKSKQDSKKAKAAVKSGKGNRRIALQVSVPHDVRKGLRNSTKARGTSLDGTVTTMVADLQEH